MLLLLNSCRTVLSAELPFRIMPREIWEGDIDGATKYFERLPPKAMRR